MNNTGLKAINVRYMCGMDILLNTAFSSGVSFVVEAVGGFHVVMIRNSHGKSQDVPLYITDVGSVELGTVRYLKDFFLDFTRQFGDVLQLECLSK